MKSILFLSLLFFTFNLIDLHAQEAIVSVDVPDMEERIYEGEEGPNRKSHQLTYYKIGVSWDYESSDQILASIPYRSFEIASGYWVKRKLNNTLALTYDNSLNFKNIRLQESGQVWGDFQGFSKESIFLFQYGGFVSLRINYDARRRGDFLGFYTDFGAFINLSYLRRHKAVNKKDGFFQLARGKSINNNPSYLQWFEYGPEFRIGKDFFVIYTRYRLNPMLKNDITGGRDMPKFTSGVIFTF